MKKYESTIDSYRRNETEGLRKVEELNKDLLALSDKLRSQTMEYEQLVTQNADLKINLQKHREAVSILERHIDDLKSQRSGGTSLFSSLACWLEDISNANQESVIKALTSEKEELKALLKQALDNMDVLRSEVSKQTDVVRTFETRHDKNVEAKLQHLEELLDKKDIKLEEVREERAKLRQQVEDTLEQSRRDKSDLKKLSEAVSSKSEEISALKSRLEIMSDQASDNKWTASTDKLKTDSDLKSLMSERDKLVRQVEKLDAKVRDGEAVIERLVCCLDSVWIGPDSCRPSRTVRLSISWILPSCKEPASKRPLAKSWDM